MMIKIGIVTLYYKNFNYGGQLQAYAMQKIFENMGCYAQLVTFETGQTSYFFQRVRDLGVKKCIESFSNKYKFKQLMKNEKFNQDITLKMKRFNDFMTSIPHTSVYSEKNIKDVNINFDAFVCGSDQIWNPGWWNDVLFLSFTNKVKFSYAASIAREKLSVKEMRYFREKVEEYVGISVREKQAQLLLEKNLNREIVFSLDPTLLLDVTIWNQIAKEPDTEKKYVLFYMVGDSKGLKEVVYRECKKKGYLVYSIGFSKNTYYEADVKYSDFVIRDAGPLEWLGWISNALYVFTDSFHGSVFSILFQKNFWCFERDNPEDSLNENSRLYNFLEITDLQHRLLGYDMNFEFNDSENIDFKKVNKRLDVYRQQSMEYIENCIKKVNINEGKESNN